MPIFVINRFHDVRIGHFYMFVIYSICLCLYEIAIIFMLGLNTEEKKWILNYCKSKIFK